MTKEARVRAHILGKAPERFRLSDIAGAMPDVSYATIRNALDELRREGLVTVGRGRNAEWTRLTPPHAAGQPQGAPRASEAISNHANLIWEIAELLRGDYKQADYGKVILPLVVIRRLDQALDETRAAILSEAAALRAQGLTNLEPRLLRVTHLPYYNDSPQTFPQLLGDPPKLAINLPIYLRRFSSLAREVMEKFEFERQIDRLARTGLLYPVVSRVCDVDLHPRRVSTLEMGYLFEELIRKFAEASNETAGEHFTPREVVRLMVNLLVNGDEEAIANPAAIRTVYDCACGTGGMLSEAYAHIYAQNPSATVHLYGQELNAESYAICLADMLVKNQDASGIRFGNSLSNDEHEDQRFHYGIANPPFGVDWTKVEQHVRSEHEDRGFEGRFGPGLPRRSDGQLLFLLHLLSKMRDPDAENGRSRVAIVQNGSPLFTGGPGSGESEIRRWILDNDWLEAIVALPEQLFYNTGIASYVWLLTNRKSRERAGLVQLVDARGYWVRLRRSLGEKRREIGESPDNNQLKAITCLYGEFREGDHVKIVPNEQFSYRTITVERPLRGSWAITPDTWSGVAEERALARLAAASAERVTDSLGALPTVTFPDEEACRRAVHDALASAGVAKPAAGMLRQLVARCLVRDPEAAIVRARDGRPIPDPERRDTENVPVTEDVETYLDREVRPWVPGAWCPDPEGRIGCEIPFTRLFHSYEPPPRSDELKRQLRELERELHELLAEALA